MEVIAGSFKEGEEVKSSLFGLYSWFTDVQA